MSNKHDYEKEYNRIRDERARSFAMFDKALGGTGLTEYQPEIDIAITMAIEGLVAERDKFKAELQNIASASPAKWQMPKDDFLEEFRPWAQNRARHAINPAAQEQQPQTLPVVWNSDGTATVTKKGVQILAETLSEWKAIADERKLDLNEKDHAVSMAYLNHLRELKALFGRQECTKLMQQHGKDEN